MSYDNLFNKGIGTVKIGRVIGITKNPDGKSGTVSLESGESIPWDVLVLVPGNVWEGGLAFPDSRVGAVKTIQDWRGKFKAADKIVLVGGGAVGIELSGELRDVYPVCCHILHSPPFTEPAFRERLSLSFTAKTNC